MDGMDACKRCGRIVEYSQLNGVTGRCHDVVACDSNLKQKRKITRKLVAKPKSLDALVERLKSDDIVEGD